MKPILFALLAAILWGIAPIFEKLGLRRAEPMAALVIRSGAVFVTLLLFTFATGIWREVQKQDVRTAVYIALGGLAAGLFGQLAYFHALKLGTPARIVPVAATYPLIASILAITLLREPVTPGKMVGAVLIVLGVLAITLDKVVWSR